jgi:uncharacterized protein
MRIGTVREIWRYPVKSMGGERLEATPLAALGVPGDRGWALRDDAAGEIRGGKKLPLLMRCAARYRDAPSDDRIPHADIELPDGTRTATDDPDVNARLSALCGRAVSLWPRRPADDREHYRRAMPEDGDLERELREIFGRLADEPLPDLMTFPPEVLEFTSPLGTYFDAYPVHLLTTASLAALERHAPASRFDVRRFRPNLLLETPDLTGLVDAEWSGRTLRFGGAVLRVETATARCSMTTHAQAELPHDPQVLRTIVREGAQNLGAYASVIEAGRVAVGDAAVLE